MKRRLVVFVSVAVVVVLCMVGYLLYYFNWIPHRQYTNDDFDIETYVSRQDQDHDGVDDQTDLLNSARTYISIKPKYKSKYYNTGYPDDEYGVCTDVVAFGMLGAGYDLMQLVNEDIANHPERYQIEKADPNIVFEQHIGVVSDKRNRDGIPFLIHNATPHQRYYEEDVLKRRDDIVGHYRIS